MDIVFLCRHMELLGKIFRSAIYRIHGVWIVLVCTRFRRTVDLDKDIYIYEGAGTIVLAMIYGARRLRVILDRDVFSHIIA